MKNSTKIILLIAGYIALYSLVICGLALLCGTFDLKAAYFGINIPLAVIWIGVVEIACPDEAK